MYFVIKNGIFSQKGIDKKINLVYNIIRLAYAN